MRIIVFVIGLLLAGGALVALAVDRAPVTLGLAVAAALLLGGLAIERWRYKKIDAAAPGAGWQATGERFVDPESGRRVTVYFNPTTGERRYIAA